MKEKKTICNNLCNFEELPLLNKKWNFKNINRFNRCKGYKGKCIYKQK